MGDGDGTGGHAGTVNEGTGFDDGRDGHSDGDNVNVGSTDFECDKDDVETGMGDDDVLGSEGPVKASKLNDLAKGSGATRDAQEVLSSEG
jgi:hypothetical protein